MAVITRKKDENGTEYVSLYVPSDAKLLIGAVVYPSGGVLELSEEQLVDLRNVIGAFIANGPNAVSAGTKKIDA